jgi:hypothetical protein
MQLNNSNISTFLSQALFDLDFAGLEEAKAALIARHDWPISNDGMTIQIAFINTKYP